MEEGVRHCLAVHRQVQCPPHTGVGYGDIVPLLMDSEANGSPPFSQEHLETIAAGLLIMFRKQVCNVNLACQ